MRTIPSLFLIAASVAIILSGCTAAPAIESESASADTRPQLGHVHGITADPAGDVLIASHFGVFRLDESGALNGPIGGNDFDGMGFTAVDDTLFASGHPGTNTPPELGSPNLGIIRSDDAGESWSSVAFASEKDFHVLTAGRDGTLYGIASDAPELLVSTDMGVTWESRAPLAALDLAVSEDALVAATEQGLQVSDDGGTTFTPLEGAPLIYSLATLADGSLVGVDVGGAVQRETPEGWVQIGRIAGTATALGVADSDRVLLVDDRGIVEIQADGDIVLSPGG